MDRLAVSIEAASKRKVGKVIGDGAVVGHLVRMDGGDKGETRSRADRFYCGGIEGDAFRCHERCPRARS